MKGYEVWLVLQGYYPGYFSRSFESGFARGKSLVAGRKFNRWWVNHKEPLQSHRMYTYIYSLHVSIFIIICDYIIIYKYQLVFKHPHKGVILIIDLPPYSNLVVVNRVITKFRPASPARPCETGPCEPGHVSTPTPQYSVRMPNVATRVTANKELSAWRFGRFLWQVIPGNVKGPKNTFFFLKVCSWTFLREPEVLSMWWIHSHLAENKGLPWSSTPFLKGLPCFLLEKQNEKFYPPHQVVPPPNAKRQDVTTAKRIDRNAEFEGSNGLQILYLNDGWGSRGVLEWVLKMMLCVRYWGNNWHVYIYISICVYMYLVP